MFLNTHIITNGSKGSVSIFAELQKDGYHVPPSSFYVYNWDFVTYKGVKVGPEHLKQ